MDDVSAFGTLAKKRRTELNLTQEALAAAALGNMDRKGYISNIERGNLPRITPTTVKKICGVLEIDQRDVPASLRWQRLSNTPQLSVPHTQDIKFSSHEDAITTVSTDPRRLDSLTFNKQVLGLGMLIGVIAFSDQISSGMSTIGANIWSDGRIAPFGFFTWCSVILSLVFFFFGLEGRGAISRAEWLERGTWRDRYIKTVHRTLARVDIWFLTESQSARLPSHSIRRNWSIGLYEKVWGFAIVYPCALLMLQWVVSGSSQQLGFVQLWPEEPEALRRAFVCLCFLAPIPMSFWARVLPNKLHRLGLCGLAFCINFLGTAYLWSVYWDVQAGPGAINMIVTAVILGVGLRLFDTVASAAAAAAISGASLSILFLPLVDLAEFITNRDGFGYNDPVVNVIHTIMNHSLNLIFFFILLNLISKIIKPGSLRDEQQNGAIIYLVISIGAALLMILASGQEFWFPYYFLIGLLPLVNAAFDFMSIGLTRLALRLGAQNFGGKTLLFSALDLFLAVILFLGLIFAAILVAIILNWMVGGAVFPFQTDSTACLRDFNSALSAETHLTVKGLLTAEDTCTNSIISNVNSSPWEFMWLILIFGSTLLPTLLHLGFALFAFGPALLSVRVRLNVAAWARRSAEDPFLRGGAALFFGIWLATVATVTLLAVQYSSSLLMSGFWFVSQVVTLVPAV